MNALEESQKSLREPSSPVPSGRTARVRLEQLIGRDFTQRLLVVLSANQGRRGSSSP